MKLPKEKKYQAQSCKNLDDEVNFDKVSNEAPLPNIRNPPLQPKLNINKKNNQQKEMVQNIKA